MATTGPRSSYVSQHHLFSAAEYLKDKVALRGLYSLLGFFERHGCVPPRSFHRLQTYGACRHTGACAQFPASLYIKRHFGWARFRAPAIHSLVRYVCSDIILQSRADPVGRPELSQFLRPGHRPASASSDIDCRLSQVPYLSEETESSVKYLYLETYGCQMNVNDMEVVLAIMRAAGYSEVVKRPEEADVILINTCAIRDNAEHKIWHRLNYFKHIKSTWSRRAVSVPRKLLSPPRVAVLGCMAERLKERLIEADKMVDVVCGPDAYRDLPRLLMQVEEGQTAINTLLSLEETYADVSPVRISKSSVSAFVSIMRGCNNMCSFCIVPFTRGRERSRPVDSVVREVGELWEQGVKEVTLLGQNVNSYNDCSGHMVEGWDPKAVVGSNPDDTESAGVSQVLSEDAFSIPSAIPCSSPTVSLSAGFSSISKVKEVGLRFVHLMDCLSSLYPQMRFRFTSPHPKDFPDELLFLMRQRPNICKSIHLPAQSGSTTVLQRMRRGYTREAYLSLVKKIRSILPSVSISSDFITGFCGETEEEHNDTLSLVEAVGYDMAYMFAYSMREKTHASRNYVDDVEPSVKQHRLAELIETFRKTTGQRYTSLVGSTQLVLVDGPNKRNVSEVIGRNDRGHRVVFPSVSLSMKEVLVSNQLHDDLNKRADTAVPKAGDYVEVRILETSTASLRGEAVALRSGL